MTTQKQNRAAIPTIRGYMYQFDATILTILRLSDREQLIVEGLEDFDIGADDPSDLFQCKYYEAQNYTPAVFRDAILPMLKGYLELEVTARKVRQFHLYGYFKNSTPSEFQPSLEDLKIALVQRRRVQTPTGQNKMEVINLQATLGVTDEVLQQFASQLIIHFCEEYERHKAIVIDELKKVMNTSTVVAEEQYYPTALTLISELATRHKLRERRTTREQFCSGLLPSRTLINAWFLHELGDARFCREMRQKHFTRQNIDTSHRYFIVDCSYPVIDEDLLSILATLRRKWSTHNVRRKPQAERYAPFVFFRGLAIEQLVIIKSTLQYSGIKFVDGYAFSGSSFNVEHVYIEQTYINSISLRFINTHTELLQCLTEVTGRHHVYDFYLDAPLLQDIEIPYTAIPIDSISKIEKII